MSKLLIVGFGKIAQNLSSSLSKNIKVFGIKRSETKNIGSIKIYRADILVDDLTSIIKEIQPNLILYSVSADEQTIQDYQNAYETGLKNVIVAAEKIECIKHFIFLSSTRVYGQNNTKNFLSEADIAKPSDFRGNSLLRGENLVLKSSIPGTIIRLSGIYGKNRNYLIKMAKNIKIWPSENRWTNRINEEDVVRFLCFLIRQLNKKFSIDSLYMLTDNHPVPLYELLNWIRTSMGLKKMKYLMMMLLLGKD